MRILPIPYNQDNLAWMIELAGDEVVIIDPGNARAIMDALARAQKNPIAFLCTHGHSDHTGGLAALAARYPSARIAALAPSARGYAPENSSGRSGAFPGKPPRVLPCHDKTVLEFDELRIHCLETPGHTSDSVCFYLPEGALFTGDTLFAAGCGRVSGASCELMFQSLARLAALPPDTRVYPGHDYLEENLRFAATLTPQNGETLRRRGADHAAGREPPSTLAAELASNPFLRAAARGGADALAEFTDLRKRKNSFM